jgi:branched-chain amino acid transport system permease protein
MLAMTVVLQQGINGVVLGGLYVLVALGLTLVYGVLVQINFAHADIVTRSRPISSCMGSAAAIPPALRSRSRWAERWAG